MGHRQTTPVVLIILAMALFTPKTLLAQENVEEDAVVVRTCSKALDLVIGWGAGKVLDHYAAAKVNAELNRLDSYLRAQRTSSGGAQQGNQLHDKAMIDSIDRTRALLRNTQNQTLTLSQWYRQTGLAVRALKQTQAPSLSVQAGRTTPSSQASNPPASEAALSATIAQLSGR
ncbi:MAG: hypothetical protein ACRD3O_23125, partial [Terriglobia bacterium]